MWLFHWHPFVVAKPLITAVKYQHLDFAQIFAWSGLCGFWRLLYVTGNMTLGVRRWLTPVLSVALDMLGSAGGRGVCGQLGLSM